MGSGCAAGSWLPCRAHGARASVIAELGDPGVARDVAAALIWERFGQRGFSGGLEDEAADAAADALAADLERRDLTALDTFTVDPETARDFDDAVSASEDAEGIRVWVHIADVAAHVRPGSGLDREAARRGNSVYVPGTVEPMLPLAALGRRLQPRPRGRPARGDDRDPDRRRRPTALGELLPQPGALGRAPLLRPARRVLRRSRGPVGAGRRAARARPPRCGDAARQPPRLRARDLDHRAGIRVRLRRRRCRGPRGRADRGSRPDRAADDLRQRASGRALRAHRGADRLPRSRAPGPDAGRGAGGQARRARHPDTAAAQGDLVDLARPGGPAGRRGEPPGGGRGRAPPPRASGVYITCLALPEARHVLRRQPRPRRLGQPRLRPFHLSDPSLRGPGRPPGAAFHDRRRRGPRPSARRRATRRSPVRGSSARRW